MHISCYYRSATHDGLDQRCITDPDSVPGNSVIDCESYCTSKRVEFKDPKDRVQSMHRGCSDKPEYVNQVIEDSTFRSYYRVCQSDLCNGGSGKSFSNIGGIIGDAGDDIVLLVPGTGTKNNSASLSFFTILLIISVIMCNLV
ncbi:hypothetical protein ILUMI_20630 [Ignelater luminosus]|uniref:Uncharacterized protein n=1 Tax=Ignelater luminosus TaxID=2038154 RepID=A0A8K0CKD4_IGNLU|nr:hypothetical protein ILUMI_20630 [Ignelater luminosus]